MKWVGQTAPAWTIKGTKKANAKSKLLNKTFDNSTQESAGFAGLDEILKGGKFLYATSSSWRFGSSKRTKIGFTSDAPGPGNYDPEKPKKLIERKFPKSKRSDPTEGTLKTPAPNTYQPKVEKTRAPSAFLGYKDDSQNVPVNPTGPGEYSPIETFRSSLTMQASKM